MKLLLDTSMWLDNYIPGRAGCDVVGEVLRLAIERRHELLYAATTAKDVFYLIAHAYKAQARAQGGLDEAGARAINEVAWACVDNMGELATAVGADVSDLWLARRYKALHPDFEDDLVLAAAQRAHVDYLVTSDEGLIRHAPVRALSAQDMLAVLRLEVA